MGKTEIIIYKTPTCPYCQMAMEYFDSLNLKYTAYDLTQEPTKAQEMIQKTNQTSVPVIIIKKDGEENIIVGFNKSEIDKILNIK